MEFRKKSLLQRWHATCFTQLWSVSVETRGNPRFDPSHYLSVELRVRKTRPLMASIFRHRRAQSRWQAIAVWAMLPLAVFNGRTIVGCGCTGHFEAACQCGSMDTAGMCSNCRANGLGSCPFCHKRDSSTAQHHRQSGDGYCGVHGHRCRGAVLHEVIPATVVAAQPATDVGFQMLLLGAADFIGVGREATDFLRADRLTTAPPDLVVQLHRLLI